MYFTVSLIDLSDLHSTAPPLEGSNTTSTFEPNPSKTWIYLDLCERFRTKSVQLRFAASPFKSKESIVHVFSDRETRKLCKLHKTNDNMLI